MCIFIELSQFPKNCKVAKLKLLYKNGTKTDPKNFSPTSLLSIASKIKEKVIHEEAMNYFGRTTQQILLSHI